uniref:Uncharacterized protein n=1 Tax=Glossina brevipalpis TaxID=37001 RepID=A0A1A9WRR2_9MUSC
MYVVFDEGGDRVGGVEGYRYLHLMSSLISEDVSPPIGQTNFLYYLMFSLLIRLLASFNIISIKFTEQWHTTTTTTTRYLLLRSPLIGHVTSGIEHISFLKDIYRTDKIYSSTSGIKQSIIIIN